MRRFLAILAMVLVLCALALTDGREALRRAYRGAPTEVYTADGITTGDADLLVRMRNAYAATLTVRDDIESILSALSVTVRNRYTVEGIRIVEGYSPLLSGGVDLPCGRVNIQLAQKDDCVKVGLPILAGAY